MASCLSAELPALTGDLRQAGIPQTPAHKSRRENKAGFITIKTAYNKARTQPSHGVQRV